MTSLSKKTFGFLKEIELNNNKPWFEANRSKYEESHEEMIQFAEGLMSSLGKYDELVPMTGKKSLFRIYRDVRFSKDKTPYKHHWAGRMKRESVWKRGGYYYHIEPGNTTLACGFWNPEKEDLKLIRDNIAEDAQPLRKILSAPGFKKVWGQLEGDKLKTAPKGFPKDHPNIDLLQHKQLVAYTKFSDKQAMSDDFMDTCLKTFRSIRPFFDYMSDILTHDLNGEPLF